MNQRGFTLVELAFVLVVIGALTAGVLVGGKQLVRQADKKSFVIKVHTLAQAVSAFRDKFHMLPGDFMVDTTKPEIPGLSEGCLSNGDGRGNGNGLIETVESPCAKEQLVRAGTLDASAFEFKFPQVQAKLMSVSAAGVPAGRLSVNARNVLKFENLPCYLAQAADATFDDGALETAVSGKAAAVSGTCPLDDEDAEIAFAVAL